MRTALLFLLNFSLLTARAQQFNLTWATQTENGVQRVKFAANGDLFTLSSGNNVMLQRHTGTGALLWTKTLSAPTLMALDMDVDGNDNVYLYLGFTTGQLDLDPGPFTTLVNPGKVYAKYSGSGQFQWGFSLENGTDLSASYGGISCDDAGNLYIAGNLGTGTYDMDPGPGVHNLVVGPSTTGIFMARYRPDGSLHWADMRQWSGGFNYTRAIAAMRNGAGFYVVQRLDNGSGLGGQVDVDPGPGVFYVYNESINLLRYDSTFAFVARAGANYGEQRLVADNAGRAYLLASAYSGGGLWAVKYNTTGQNLNQVYQTTLPSSGNVRLAHLAVDGQGGVMGAYSVNCNANYYRFYKMNVSGLVDLNFQLYSGSDCTYPIVRGFDLRGDSFAVGSYNNNYAVDFDPGVPVQSLPTGTNKGVVALYNWCSGAPFEPLGINLLSTSWCVGDTVALSAHAFGDASSYTWNAGTWSLASGQGDTLAYVVATNAGPATVSVTADNACGSSAAVSQQITAGMATAVLPADTVACLGLSTVLDPGPCAGCTFLWMPGGATTPTLPVSITETATYSVMVTQGNCTVGDSILLTIETCAGINGREFFSLAITPVPAMRGETVTVSGLPPGSLLRLITLDGRIVLPSIHATNGKASISTGTLAPGLYLLQGAAEKALRLVVQ